jgi:hypothetical protein
MMLHAMMARRRLGELGAAPLEQRGLVVCNHLKLKA